MRRFLRVLRRRCTVLALLVSSLDPGAYISRRGGLGSFSGSSAGGRLSNLFFLPVALVEPGCKRLHPRIGSNPGAAPALVARSPKVYPLHPAPIRKCKRTFSFVGAVDTGKRSDGPLMKRRREILNPARRFGVFPIFTGICKPSASFPCPTATCPTSTLPTTKLRTRTPKLRTATKTWVAPDSPRAVPRRHP